MAQGDALTEEFGRLSAKERTRIAQEEIAQAANDQQYQQVMAEADEHFRHQRYEDALERYTVARAMRPYNVYPKVKIQDLQALMEKRDAETKREALTVLVEEPGGSAAPVFDTPVPVKEEVAPPSGPKAAQPEKRSEVKPVPRPSPVIERQAVIQDPPTPDEGMTERTLREGRAVVLERVLVQDGRITTWRKVDHPWGQTVYFRDGIAVSERLWEETFPGR